MSTNKTFNIIGHIIVKIIRVFLRHNAMPLCSKPYNNILKQSDSKKSCFRIKQIDVVIKYHFVNLRMVLRPWTQTLFL